MQRTDTDTSIALAAGDGGVPNVDYSTKDKVKDALTGHDSSSSSSDGGLIGSGRAPGATSGLTGSSQATHGISDTAERDLNKHSGTGGTHSRNRQSDLRSEYVLRYHVHQRYRNRRTRYHRCSTSAGRIGYL